MDKKKELQEYLEKKLEEMVEARRREGREPESVTGREFHDAVMDDMSEALWGLIKRGRVEKRQGLNDLLLRVREEEERYMAKS